MGWPGLKPTRFAGKRMGRIIIRPYGSAAGVIRRSAEPDIRGSFGEDAVVVQAGQGSEGLREPWGKACAEVVHAAGCDDLKGSGLFEYGWVVEAGDEWSEPFVEIIEGTGNAVDATGTIDHRGGHVVESDGECGKLSGQLVEESEDQILREVHGVAFPDEQGGQVWVESGFRQFVGEVDVQVVAVHGRPGLEAVAFQDLPFVLDDGRLVHVEEGYAVHAEYERACIEARAHRYDLPRAPGDLALDQFAEEEQATADEVVKFGAEFSEALSGRLHLIGDEPLGVGVVEQGVRAIPFGVAEPGDEERRHPDVVDIDGGNHGYTSWGCDVWG